MNLATIKPVIALVVAAAAGIPAVWAEQRRPFVAGPGAVTPGAWTAGQPNGAIVHLSLLPSRGQDDDIRYVYTEVVTGGSEGGFASGSFDPGSFEVYSAGSIGGGSIGGFAPGSFDPGSFEVFAIVGEEISIQAHGHRYMSVQCRVEAFDNRDGFEATTFAERLRTHVQAPSRRALLDAVNVGLVTARPTIDLGPMTIDDHAVTVAVIELLLCIGIAEEIERTTYIEHVDITSHAKTADGNESGANATRRVTLDAS